MAFVIKDRVRETTATTGTGTVTLAGAVSGYQSFSAIGNGNTTYYCIAGQGTNEWEVGIGTYTSAGTTLSRTTVLSSSNSGSLVPFSAGTKDVFVTQPASRAVFQDDLLDASTGNNFNAVSYNGGQLAGLRNKIINGSFIVYQRPPTSNTSTGFVTKLNNIRMLDRWSYIATTSATSAVTQEIDAPASDPDLYYSMRLTTVTPTTFSSASNYFTVVQCIEGPTARTLVGQTFTISFWVKATVTGIYSLTLLNNSDNFSDRTYVTEYTVNASNTWEYKTVTIPGGLITAGTWNWTYGTSGVMIAWTLGSGTNAQTSTLNSWITGGVGTDLCSTNQVNALATASNIFALTGVQVEAGTVATAFEHRPIELELYLCQRYFEKSFPYATAPAQNVGSSVGAAYATAAVTGQTFSYDVRYTVPKTYTPSASLTFTYSPNAATANWSTDAGSATTPTATVLNQSQNGFAVTGTASVSAGVGYTIHWAVYADL
jgi:hypothetical protein